jgi:ubiquinone/menaquinone biosynthesis C-methylase UbiE
MSVPTVSADHYYNDDGWDEDDGITLDAELNEDLRRCARPYVTACRRRVLQHLSSSGERLLDMASGPIQYPEYLEYSQGFRKRLCVDLSKKALEGARIKIGEEHGEFMCGDFLELNLPRDHVDATVSLHTLYHVESNQQEEVVRKLLRVTKTGGAVIIVYKNPHEWSRPFVRFLKKLSTKIKSNHHEDQKIQLYHEAHPLEWWDRFQDEAEMTIQPWRSFSARHQKFIFPDNAVGKWMFKLLYQCETHFPKFFVQHFKFPMIVLIKRT